MTNIVPFNVQRTELRRYIRLSNYLGFGSLILFAYIFFALVVLAEENVASSWLILHAVWLGSTMLVLILWLNWYSTRYVNALSYRLEDETLRIKEGVFTWKHKAIPLDRISDIMMTQGILMRRLGLWRIDVQTASLGATGAEGTLHGIGDPKHVREILLAARNASVSNGSQLTIAA